MANDLYPCSREEAVRRNELSLWRENLRENLACKQAIEDAIRRDFDGMHLKSDCAQSVIGEYGYNRVRYVLAVTVQQADWDGRYSRANRAWATGVPVTPDRDKEGLDRNYELAVSSHPAVLDGFIDEYRRAFSELGLFDRTQCEPDDDKLDYEGKVLVLSPDVLKEGCWRPEAQLWLATGGFGCHPNVSGRAVFATCLGDGEETRWNRSDFIGVLKSEHLPDWAVKKLSSLQSPKGDVAGMSDMSLS